MAEFSYFSYDREHGSLGKSATEVVTGIFLMARKFYELNTDYKNLLQ